MARYKGYQGSAEVGANAIGELVSFDLEISVNTTDSSTMGGDWAAVDGLQKAAKGKIEVFRDGSDLAQIALVAGAVVALSLYTEGDTTGLTKISGNFLVESTSFVTGVNDLVKCSYSVVNQGAVTIGVVV